MAYYRINQRTVTNQANTISNLADDLGREITTLENLLANVKSNWIGPASDEYKKQLVKLIDHMKATKKDMKNVATDIKNAAKKIQNEDEERIEAELAKNNSSTSGSTRSF